MRSVTNITPNQKKRVKQMCLVFFAGLAYEYVSQNVVLAKIKDRIYDGDYAWGGETYSKF